MLVIGKFWAEIETSSSEEQTDALVFMHRK